MQWHCFCYDAAQNLNGKLYQYLVCPLLDNLHFLSSHSSYLTYKILAQRCMSVWHPDRACLRRWWLQLDQMVHRRLQSCSSGRGSCRTSPQRDRTGRSEETWRGSRCSLSASCLCLRHTDKEEKGPNCCVTNSAAGKFFYFLFFILDDSKLIQKKVRICCHRFTFST